MRNRLVITALYAAMATVAVAVAAADNGPAMAGTIPGTVVDSGRTG